MDHAVGDGGLSHEKTVEWIHKFQPNCFVGFNSGETAGRLNIREKGRPGSIGEDNAYFFQGHIPETYDNFLVAEFTYPILPVFLEDGSRRRGGAEWFYSLPEHDNLVHPAEKTCQDYLGALKYGNIFSLNVGPDYEGKLRDIDVRTLTELGKMIQEWEIKK